MIEFIKTNSGVIPFAIAMCCNLWVSADLFFGKKNYPHALAFLAYAVASFAFCWGYYFQEG